MKLSWTEFDRKRLLAFFLNIFIPGSGFMIYSEYLLGAIYLIACFWAGSVRVSRGPSFSILPFIVNYIGFAHLYYITSNRMTYNFSCKWSIKNAILFLLYFWAFPFFYMNFLWIYGRLPHDLIVDLLVTFWGLIAGIIAYQRTQRNWPRTIGWFLLTFFSELIFVLPTGILVLYFLHWPKPEEINLPLKAALDFIYGLPALIILYYLIVWYNGKKKPV